MSALTVTVLETSLREKHADSVTHFHMEITEVLTLLHNRPEGEQFPLVQTTLHNCNLNIKNKQKDLKWESNRASINRVFFDHLVI